MEILQKVTSGILFYVSKLQNKEYTIEKGAEIRYNNKLNS